MWQLIRMVVSLLCGFPWIVRIILVLILPAIPGFISPLNQAVLWLFIFCPIYFGNTGLSKNDAGEREFKISFRNSYFIYHAVFVVLYGIALFSVCTVSDTIGAYGV